MAKMYILENLITKTIAPVKKASIRIVFTAKFTNSLNHDDDIYTTGRVIG